MLSASDRETKMTRMTKSESRNGLGLLDLQPTMTITKLARLP